jgi:GNAT superfamily N-acetyltransferase
MPHNKLQVFCNVDYDTEIAIIGLVGSPGNEDVVGIGAYATDAAKASAEVAFSVRDDFQRKGLGGYLFGQLVNIGRTHDISRYEAYVLTENVGMMTVFHRSGLITETATENGVIHIRMEVAEDPPESEEPR